MLPPSRTSALPPHLRLRANSPVPIRPPIAQIQRRRMTLSNTNPTGEFGVMFHMSPAQKLIGQNVRAAIRQRDFLHIIILTIENCGSEESRGSGPS